MVSLWSLNNFSMSSIWDLFLKFLGVAGSGPAAQADSAGMPNVLQPDPAATSHCMNQSRVTSYGCNSDRTSFAGSNNFAKEGPADLNLLSHDSQSTSILPSNSKVIAIPALTRTSKVDAKGLQTQA